MRRNAFIWAFVAAAALALGGGAAAASGQGSIRLMGYAVVTGDRVLLRDVAELQGEPAQSLGDVVVATFGPGGGVSGDFGGSGRSGGSAPGASTSGGSGGEPAVVTIDSVRRALDAHGVNWAVVTLRGHGACQVRRSDHPHDRPAQADRARAAIEADAVDFSSAGTLQDRVIELIERFAGLDRQQLRIEFTDSDEQTLSQRVGWDRYELEPLSSVAVGRVPIVLRRWDGDRLVEVGRVTAEVARRRVAVVARATIGRGQTIAPGDLELRELYLTTPAEPLASPEHAVGRIAAAVIRAGAAIYPDQLRSPLLVRRGESVTVRCVSGALVIKAVGRAMQDGGLGGVIEVRNDRSGETYSVRVTGTQEGTVETAPASGTGARGSSAEASAVAEARS